MAIPKVYQTQNQVHNKMQMGNDMPVGRRDTSVRLDAPTIQRKKRKSPINLHKNMKYLALGSIYIILFFIAKCTELVSKWESDIYNFEVPGFSLSVGRKAKASTESQNKDSSAMNKNADNIDKTKQKKKSELNPVAKDSISTGANSASKSGQNPTVPDTSLDKKKDIVTLKTDVVGFDPLSTSSREEVELLLKLADRRKDIDTREADLKKRELVLAVAEKQQKDKILELTKLKDSIETLLKKTDKVSQDHLVNLVKFYEGMKPKNAAQVFDRIDMSVLKDLVPLMSQRKVSAILDQMSVVKAKELSLVLIGDKNPFAKAPASAPKKQ